MVSAQDTRKLAEHFMPPLSTGLQSCVFWLNYVHEPSQHYYNSTMTLQPTLQLYNLHYNLQLYNIHYNYYNLQPSTHDGINECSLPAASSSWRSKIYNAVGEWTESSDIILTLSKTNYCLILFCFFFSLGFRYWVWGQKLKQVSVQWPYPKHPTRAEACCVIY